jgi:hypothetical protein
MVKDVFLYRIYEKDLVQYGFLLLIEELNSSAVENSFPFT